MTAITLSLFGYTGLTLFIIIVTLAATIALADGARHLVHRTAIDTIEILARFHQMIIDRDRQRAELESNQDQHAARLQAWQQRARLRLAEQRQQMIIGGSNDGNQDI